MSRVKYSKKLADGGDVTPPSDPAPTNADSDVANTGTNSLSPDSSSSSDSSASATMAAARHKLAKGPAVGATPGFAGGFASGLSTGSKLAEAFAAKADGGPIGDRRTRYAKKK